MNSNGLIIAYIFIGIFATVIYILAVKGAVKGRS